MLRVVQDLSVDGYVVPIEGRSYPAPCVVEDDDGVRALILTSESDRSIPSSLWAQAHALGVGYLLLPGERWLAVTSENFMDHRVEQPRHARYDFDPDGWGLFEALPSYRDLVLSEGFTPPGEDEITGFVHLHTHSHYSALDGLSKIEEMVDSCVADGQQALASSDHGNCAAHPELAEKCAKAGLKPIFGMEANLVLDRHRRGRSWMVMVDADGVEYEVDPTSVDKEVAKTLVRRSDANDVLYDYQHVTLWAMSDKGLRNLWAMSTESYREGFYGRPRLDYQTLERLSEGVLASTGCLRGPLAQPVMSGDLALAHQNVAKMMAIFPDRLYVEIHTNQLEEQIKVNQTSVSIAQSLGLPMIAAVDSHYTAKDDKETHRAWLAMQTGKDLSEESSLFAGGHDYHMHTQAEVRSALSYLDPGVVDTCIANTAALANRCTAVLAGDVTPPIYSKPSAEHPDPVKRDVERLIDMCLANWERKVTGKRLDVKIYEDRFVREMELLIAKQFCGYFLVVADYVNWAKDQGCLVGPGRGSGGGSLVAYLCGIIEIDAVDGDLIFERFLTEGRTSLPDFDVDFPASWRERLKAYLIRRWGEDYVLTIGTVTRLQTKGAFNDAVRVLKPTLPYEVNYMDANLLKKAITAADAHLAGKHMPWDEFCVEYADIVDPLRAKYPEPMALMEKILYRIKSYGKHPAGVVVSTGAPLTDLPMRVDDKGNLISQFDMNALELLGYVKFDLLTLRTLDTIQATIDLIQEKFGRRIEVYDWRDEYDDPQVWEQVSDGHTMGIFQIETKAGTRLTKQHHPKHILDLADVMTLVRPGPMRSKLTETYLKRRDGLEEVSYPDPRMAEVLEPTYGAIIYQEQVMACVMKLAGYDSTKADDTRRMLGKKKVELVEAAGREFVEAAVVNGMTREDSEHLWAQLAEFAKYGFGKAHAYGYSVLGYWTAWLKFHFPVQFFCAALSTVDDDRLPDFVNEARRMGYAIGGPDVNESKVLFKPGDMTVRYGLSSVKGVGLPTAEFIVNHQPYSSMEDFTTKCLVKDSPFDKGHLSALVSVGAFDSLITNRRAVEMTLEAESSGAAKMCSFKNLNSIGPRGLPCTYDWDNEPNPPMVAKGRGADKTFTPKEPPKKCTVGCRNYLKPPPIDPDTVAPYTEDDIRDREKELLGVWLSSSPFDRLDPEDLAAVHTGEEVDSGPINAEYVVAALVNEVKEKIDVRGGRYAFIGLDAQGQVVDAICFASTYEKVRPYLRKDGLVFAVLFKTERGVNLTALRPAL